MIDEGVKAVTLEAISGFCCVGLITHLRLDLLLQAFNLSQGARPETKVVFGQGEVTNLFDQVCKG